MHLGQTPDTMDPKCDLPRCGEALFLTTYVMLFRNYNITCPSLFDGLALTKEFNNGFSIFITADL